MFIFLKSNISSVQAWGWCFQAASRLKIVHPSFDNSLKEEESIEWKALRKEYYLKNLNGDFCEFSCSNSPGPHCKSMPSRLVGPRLKDNEVLKRGSVYQSSREIRRMRKLGEGRRKVKLAHSDKGFISFEITDSLSHIFWNEASQCQQEKISPCASLNAKLKSAPTDTSLSIRTRSIETTGVPLLPEEHSKVKSLYPSFTSTKKSSAFPSKNAGLELFGRKFVQKPNLKFNQMPGAENAGEVLYEQDMVDTLTKSFSAKVGISYPSCHLERDPFKVNTKTWLNPLKKMLNPITKSKSQRNPSLMEREDIGVRTVDSASIRRNSMYCKFLSNDFLKATEKLQPIGRVIKRDQGLVSSSSPAHIQGTLRLHHKHDIPYFEFSTEVPEDVLSAKAWRMDSANNWVYTFYSCKKRGNNFGSGKKNKKGQSFPMIGQMQVSSYWCLETTWKVTSNQSIVTEFILYDIAQARSFAVEERSQCSSDSVQPLVISAGDLVIGSPLEPKRSTEPANCQYSVRHALSECDYDASSFYPWEPADLHSHFEIAAIVIQIPSNKKESAKNVEMNANITREHQNLSSVSTIDQVRGTISSNWNPANVKVVTPSGTHGLAATEKLGPSSLLDRWRSGGGCDCGGWDMACPIFVFGNSSGVVADCLTMGSQPHIALFFQGRKDEVSALSISPDEGGGLYSVHFHAQLSTLQAFSICIAILHSSETSPLVDQQSRQRLHSDALKLLPREEVRHEGGKQPKRNEPQRRE